MIPNPGKKSNNHVRTKVRKSSQEFSSKVFGLKGLLSIKDSYQSKVLSKVRTKKVSDCIVANLLAKVVEKATFFLDDFRVRNVQSAKQSPASQANEF